MNFGTSLVVCAHPDDEVLGAGGTIAKIVSEGHRVDVLFLSDGVMARASDSEKLESEKAHRRATAQKACAVLGVSGTYFHDFPDNQMDSVPSLEVVKVIEITIQKLKPASVLTHSPFDLNIDHKIVANAVAVATRPTPLSSVRNVIQFEVPSSTEWAFNTDDVFRPSLFVDISKFLDLKLKALQSYEVEMRPWPHPRSFDGVAKLAAWRGVTVGVDAAEAFQILRIRS